MIAALHAVLLIPLGIFAMMVGYLLLLSNSWHGLEKPNLRQKHLYNLFKILCQLSAHMWRSSVFYTEIVHMQEFVQEMRVGKL